MMPPVSLPVTPGPGPAQPDSIRAQQTRMIVRFRIRLACRKLERSSRRAPPGCGKLAGRELQSMIKWRQALIAGFLVLTAAAPAGAANWLEMNFYMSGPRYDGALP